tara:strand:+ start:343 stop:678 length:336 start_codon:yes stop_codon:yes gene_type:complete
MGYLIIDTKKGKLLVNSEQLLSYEFNSDNGVISITYLSGHKIEVRSTTLRGPSGSQRTTNLQQADADELLKGIMLASQGNKSYNAKLSVPELGFKVVPLKSDSRLRGSDGP